MNNFKRGDVVRIKEYAPFPWDVLGNGDKKTGKVMDTLGEMVYIEADPWHGEWFYADMVELVPEGVQP